MAARALLRSVSLPSSPHHPSLATILAPRAGFVELLNVYMRLMATQNILLTEFNNLPPPPTNDVYTRKLLGYGGGKRDGNCCRGTAGCKGGDGIRHDQFCLVATSNTGIPPPGGAVGGEPRAWPRAPPHHAATGQLRAWTERLFANGAAACPSSYLELPGVHSEALELGLALPSMPASGTRTHAN